MRPTCVRHVGGRREEGEMRGEGGATVRSKNLGSLQQPDDLEFATVSQTLRSLPLDLTKEINKNMFTSRTVWRECVREGHTTQGCSLNSPPPNTMHRWQCWCSVLFSLLLLFLRDRLEAVSLLPVLFLSFSSCSLLVLAYVPPDLVSLPSSCMSSVCFRSFCSSDLSLPCCLRSFCSSEVSFLLLLHARLLFLVLRLCATSIPSSHLLVEYFSFFFFSFLLFFVYAPPPLLFSSFFLSLRNLACNTVD